MSISVVTVILNAAADLPLTIESVRQQDYRDVELIVVDGGSYDDSAAVLSRYADVIDKVVRIEDAGIYHAMNTALDHCSKEYVLFLNAKDTLFDAGLLTRMMACKQEGVDVFFGNHVYVQGRREYLKHSFDYDLSMAMLRRGEIDHTWLSRLPGHQATFVRTKLLRRLRFDTSIAICADHDLLVRAYRAGASIQFIDQTVSHYVGGGFSAQQPDRLSLEWCALYRQGSREPAAVDRFFLGDVQSPFGLQTAMTGVFLAGDYLREMSESGKPISWCRPDGTRLRSPQGASSELWLEGFCPFEDQQLLFFCGDHQICVLSPNKGWFRETLTFDPPLDPSSIVDIAAIRFGEVSHVDKRIVGFAIASFAFDGMADAHTLLARGDKLSFSLQNQAVTAPMICSGWSNQEDELIWTIAEVATLRARFGPSVTAIALTCGGNPFIEEEEQRGVEIKIDGRPMGRYLLKDRQEIVMPHDGIATSGVSTIELRPLARRGGGQEERTLGVCLLRLECR